MTALSPSQCWTRAVAQAGGADDGESVRERYRDLLRANGHLVPRASGEPVAGCALTGEPAYTIVPDRREYEGNWADADPFDWGS